MKTSKILFASLFALSLGSLGACGGGGKKSDTTTTAPATKTLFDRLGGLPAITAVVDDFVNNVAADTRINTAFATTNVPELKQKVTDQVCSATGGPCTYKGKDMKTAHQGMNISEEQFTAFVEDLVKSLDKFKVGETEKNELLGALGGMKGDIVGQ